MKPKLVPLTAIFLCLIIAACSSSNEQTTKPNASFDNTRWVLRALNDKKIYTPEGQKEIFITFTTDGNKFHGSGGCNNIFGTYQKVKNNLTFGPVASTEMFCEGQMDNEKNFTKALAETAKFKIKGDNLYLYDSTNKITTKFEAVYLR